jgi:hypothetical protein
MPSTINIESKLEEPVRFFLMYPSVGRGLLDNKYKGLKEYDEYFDVEKGTAFILFETQIDEDVKETSLVEYPFEDFIRNRFGEEILISKSLVSEFYKSYTNIGDQEFAYKRLLRAFIKNFDSLKTYPHYPESELLPAALIEIVSHAMVLYRMMFNDPMERQVNTMIRREELLTGQTGFNLKAHQKGKIPELNRIFIFSSFIDPETKPAQWYKFFSGKYTENKINWIGQPAALKYFIDQISCDKFMDSPPKQRYKHLAKIFLLKGDELNPDFYKNHYYLGKKAKNKIDGILTTLFS